MKLANLELFPDRLWKSAPSTLFLPSCSICLRSSPQNFTALFPMSSPRLVRISGHQCDPLIPVCGHAGRSEQRHIVSLSTCWLSRRRLRGSSGASGRKVSLQRLFGARPPDKRRFPPDIPGNQLTGKSTLRPTLRAKHRSPQDTPFPGIAPSQARRARFR